MIRPAKLEDIDTIIELGRQMHVESPRWSRLAFSEQRVRQTVTSLIDSSDGLVLVAQRDDKIVGGIMALMSLDWMSDQRIAQDLALFMLPEYRASMTPCRLISAFVAWAKIKGALWVEVGVSTGIHTERTAALYERLGFERTSITLENRNV